MTSEEMFCESFMQFCLPTTPDMAKNIPWNVMVEKTSVVPQNKTFHNVPTSHQIFLFRQLGHLLENMKSNRLFSSQQGDVISATRRLIHQKTFPALPGEPQQAVKFFF